MIRNVLATLIFSLFAVASLNSQTTSELEKKLQDAEIEIKRLQSLLEIAQTKNEVLKMKIDVLEASQSSNYEASTIEIQAGVTFRDGSVQPLASTEFFFSSKSLKDCLVEIGEISTTEDNPYQKLSYSVYIASLFGKPNPTIDKLKKFFEDDGISRIVKTGIDGKAKIEKVNVGEYYLFGAKSVSNSALIWDMPIKIEGRTVQAILDQDNVIHIFSGK